MEYNYVISVIDSLQKSDGKQNSDKVLNDNVLYIYLGLYFIAND